MITVEVTTETGTVRVTRQDVISLGRETDNDVCLDLPYISRHHAVIESRDGAYRVRDLGGPAGTFLRNQPILGEATLQPGETFMLAGRIPVRLLPNSPQPAPRPQVAVRPLTPPQRPASPPAGHEIQIPAGSRTVTIGRDPNNSIPLDSPQVSRLHARAELTDQGWLLSDLHSTNGTFVNGKAVSQVLVGDHDAIVVGPYTLRLGSAAVGVQQATRIGIEAFHLTRVVGSAGKERTILDDVSLVITPGEFVAVIGGTGAGKSTLLRALTGIEPAKGEVLINGVSLYHNFDALRGQFGYVPQQDILHQELPLGTALDFAAELRMPSDTTKAERAARVTICLERLGLGALRATPVARLSGGERKRASIAMELLTEPRLLFLDEPTSSLDPKYDKEVMLDLRRLADDGHTIVLITHRTSNITGTCDKVVVLGRGGRLAYTGPPEQALPYFRRTGAALMAQWPEYKTAITREKVQPSQFDDIYSIIEPPRWPDGEMDRIALYWKDAYGTSPLHEQEVTRRQTHSPEQPATPPPSTHNAAKGRADAFRQFTVLCRRYLCVLRNDRRNLAILLLQAPILAVLLVALFHHGDFLPPCAHGLYQDCFTAIPPSVANRDAVKVKEFVFILAAIAVWLGTLNAIREIAKEDDIYRRERLINLKVLPYVGSKLAVLFGAAAVQVFTLVVLSEILLRPFKGLPEMAGSFLLLLLAAAAGTAGALAVSAQAPNQDRAMLAAPLLVIPQIMFSGVFVTVASFPVVVQPVAALAAARWGFEGVGRAMNMAPLFGDPNQMPDDYSALTGVPLPQVIALLLLFAAFTALTCWLVRRKTA